KGQTILASEIGNREYLSLLPEIGIGKARNIAHIYARTHNPAALAHRFQRQRHQRADRCENQRSIQRHRRFLHRRARPYAAQRPRKPLPCSVSLARERIDLTSLPNSHLREDVRGRAKTIETDALRLTS